ncbi:MAG: hypothetical protein ABIW76_09095 [Fibrobacteria bacterium]
MPMVFRIPSLLVSSLVALLLCSCMVKDKPDKAITSGGMTPPWDPARFLPKTLEGFAYAGPESLFTVFKDIARLDSLSGDPKSWKPEAGSADTLRVSQMFDSGFVFPQNSEAVMPYGFDDSFRDDTLFRSYYGNGLFIQDHPCAATFVLSDRFMHPARWLRNGLKQEEIIASLGKPLYHQDGVLRYLSHHPSHTPVQESRDTLSTEPDYNAYEVFEGVNLYFLNDSLFAAVLQKSQPCH